MTAGRWGWGKERQKQQQKTRSKANLVKYIPGQVYERGSSDVHPCVCWSSISFDTFKL